MIDYRFLFFRYVFEKTDVIILKTPYIFLAKTNLEIKMTFQGSQESLSII